MYKGKKILQPPAQIGIIGGGQLGKMLTVEAKRMGYYVTILDPTPASPAGQVADHQIVASFSDAIAIKKLAEQTDVITYEFEHINADMLCCLESEGYSVFPSGRTLKKIQNKYNQKLLLAQKGLPVPSFYKVNNEEDIMEKLEKLGSPLVLKTCSGGYDGKGNIIVRDKKDIAMAYDMLREQELMAEQLIEFTKELSIVVARDFSGKTVYYPTVENIHKDSILHLTRVPADIDDDVKEQVEDIATKVLDVLDDVGVFCIEMFLDSNGRIYINEIAPRPHNSGHYTIEGCITSQFEQLIRIVAGMPLGSVKLISPCVMVNILGNDTVQGKYTFEGIESALTEEGCYIHLYGKHATGKFKKIGHITVLDDILEKAEEKALRALKSIEIKPL